MKKKRQNDDVYSLVYSTDPISPKTCSNCRKPLPECKCIESTLNSSTIKPAIRLERKGRGGKDVTVISKLPPHDHFLKELLSTLKRSLGSGGTHYISNGEGIIEIQGDHREKILKIIAKAI